MAVEVQCDPDAAVPQAFRDDFRMGALLEHEAGVGVAGVNGALPVGSWGRLAPFPRFSLGRGAK